MSNLHLVTGYAGQAHVTSADDGSFNRAIFGSGQYVFDIGSKFAASVVSNNKITIADGDLLMQGRHVRLNEGTTVDLTVNNGEQGKLRNDLIVARYTMDSVSGVEEVNLVVIQGTAVDSGPVDPEYTSGDIINDHAPLNDMPLYRVPLNGLNVGAPVALFGLVPFKIQDDKTIRAEGINVQDVAKLQKASDGSGAVELLDKSGNTAYLTKEKIDALKMPSRLYHASQFIDDINETTHAGWYRTHSNTANLPNVEGMKYAAVFVLNRNAYVYQTLFSADGFSNITIMVRSRQGESWQEWQYVNPPMVVGEEYATTERYNDRVVYTKLINCGTASNGKTYTEASNIRIIRHAGTLGSPNETLPYNISGRSVGDTYWADSYADSYILKFLCSSAFDPLGKTWIEQIWYIKV